MRVLLGSRPEDAAGRARGKPEVCHLPEGAGQLPLEDRRKSRVAERLARMLLSDYGVKFDSYRLKTAVKLAKTDLTTELVKEFTELQGVIGGLYARAQGWARRSPVHLRPVRPHRLKTRFLQLSKARCWALRTGFRHHRHVRHWQCTHGLKGPICSAARRECDCEDSG